MGQILEVGIGDGQPYSKDMLFRGYEVYGVDIAPFLISKVQKTFPEIRASVGDAENLNFPNNYFDITFCFRSSWYFPDIEKAIGEMVRVTNKRGGIMFDLQNANSPLHIKAIKKRELLKKYHFFFTAVRYCKNITKLLLRPIKYYKTDWSILKPIIFETPSDVPSILSSLPNNVRITIFGVNWSSTSMLQEINNKQIDLYDRIVVTVIKT